MLHTVCRQLLQQTHRKIPLAVQYITAVSLASKLVSCTQTKVSIVTPIITVIVTPFMIVIVTFIATVIVKFILT